MIKAKKSLGQNFLVDGRVSRRIVESVSPRRSDVVIEIGPGTGALTRLLADASGHLTAIEVDPRLTEDLRRSLPADRVKIIEADALALDWDLLIEESVRRWRERTGDASEPRVRIVANLPYYISTPILERLLGVKHRLFDMTLMLQSEVVERIASAPGGREYGYLSVLVQYHCHPRKLLEVPPSAFRPPPKIWSAILRLSVRDEPPVAVADEERLFALVRAAFAQRRKTIANNLKAAAGLGFARAADEALALAGIDSKRRAETLSIEEFGRLYAALFTL